MRNRFRIELSANFELRPGASTFRQASVTYIMLSANMHMQGTENFQEECQGRILGDGPGLGTTLRGKGETFLLIPVNNLIAYVPAV